MVTYRISMKRVILRKLVMGIADAVMEVDGREIYLRTDVNGDQATFSWSTDGESWNRIGEEFGIAFGNWRGDRIGLYCWNDATDDPAESGRVDVDYFEYSHGE